MLPSEAWTFPAGSGAWHHNFDQSLLRQQAFAARGRWEHGRLGLGTPIAQHGAPRLPSRHRPGLLPRLALPVALFLSFLPQLPVNPATLVQGKSATEKILILKKGDTLSNVSRTLVWAHKRFTIKSDQDWHNDRQEAVDLIKAAAVEDPALRAAPPGKILTESHIVKLHSLPRQFADNLQTIAHRGAVAAGKIKNKIKLLAAHPLLSESSYSRPSVPVIPKQSLGHPQPKIKAILQPRDEPQSPPKDDFLSNLSDFTKLLLFYGWLLSVGGLIALVNYRANRRTTTPPKIANPPRALLNKVDMKLHDPIRYLYAQGWRLPLLWQFFFWRDKPLEFRNQNDSGWRLQIDADGYLHVEKTLGKTISCWVPRYEAAHLVGAEVDVKDSDTSQLTLVLKNSNSTFIIPLRQSKDLPIENGSFVGFEDKPLREKYKAAETDKERDAIVEDEVPPKEHEKHIQPILDAAEALLKEKFLSREQLLEQLAEMIKEFEGRFADNHVYEDSGAPSEVLIGRDWVKVVPFSNLNTLRARAIKFHRYILKKTFNAVYATLTVVTPGVSYAEAVADAFDLAPLTAIGVHRTRNKKAHVKDSGLLVGMVHNSLTVPDVASQRLQRLYEYGRRGTLMPGVHLLLAPEVMHEIMWDGTRPETAKTFVQGVGIFNREEKDHPSSSSGVILVSLGNSYISNNALVRIPANSIAITSNKAIGKRARDSDKLIARAQDAYKAFVTIHWKNEYPKNIGGKEHFLDSLGRKMDEALKDLEGAIRAQGPLDPQQMARDLAVPQDTLQQMVDLVQQTEPLRSKWLIHILRIDIPYYQGPKPLSHEELKREVDRLYSLLENEQSKNPVLHQFAATHSALNRLKNLLQSPAFEVARDEDFSITQMIALMAIYERDVLQNLQRLLDGRADSPDKTQQVLKEVLRRVRATQLVYHPEISEVPGSPLDNLYNKAARLIGLGSLYTSSATEELLEENQGSVADWGSPVPDLQGTLKKEKVVLAQRFSGAGALVGSRLGWWRASDHTLLPFTQPHVLGEDPFRLGFLEPPSASQGEGLGLVVSSLSGVGPRLMDVVDWFDAFRADSEKRLIAPNILEWGPERLRLYTFDINNEEKQRALEKDLIRASIYRQRILAALFNEMKVAVMDVIHKGEPRKGALIGHVTLEPLIEKALAANLGIPQGVSATLRENMTAWKKIHEPIRAKRKSSVLPQSLIYIKAFDRKYSDEALRLTTEMIGDLMEEFNVFSVYLDEYLASHAIMARCSVQDLNGWRSRLSDDEWAELTQTAVPEQSEDELDEKYEGDVARIVQSINAITRDRYEKQLRTVEFAYNKKRAWKDNRIESALKKKNAELSPQGRGDSLGTGESPNKRIEAAARIPRKHALEAMAAVDLGHILFSESSVWNLASQPIAKVLLAIRLWDEAVRKVSDPVASAAERKILFATWSEGAENTVCSWNPRRDQHVTEFFEKLIDVQLKDLAKRYPFLPYPEQVMLTAEAIQDKGNPLRLELVERLWKTIAIATLPEEPFREADLKSLKEKLYEDHYTEQMVQWANNRNTEGVSFWAGALYDRHIIFRVFGLGREGFQETARSAFSAHGVRNLIQRVVHIGLEQIIPVVHSITLQQTSSERLTDMRQAASEAVPGLLKDPGSTISSHRPLWHWLSNEARESLRAIHVWQFQSGAGGRGTLPDYSAQGLALDYFLDVLVIKVMGLLPLRWTFPGAVKDQLSAAFARSGPNLLSDRQFLEWVLKTAPRGPRALLPAGPMVFAEERIDSLQEGVPVLDETVRGTHIAQSSDDLDFVNPKSGIKSKKKINKSKGSRRRDRWDEDDDEFAYDRRSYTGYLWTLAGASGVSLGVPLLLTFGGRQVFPALRTQDLWTTGSWIAGVSIALLAVQFAFLAAKQFAQIGHRLQGHAHLGDPLSIVWTDTAGEWLDINTFIDGLTTWDEFEATYAAIEEERLHAEERRGDFYAKTWSLGHALAWRNAREQAGTSLEDVRRELKQMNWLRKLELNSIGGALNVMQQILPNLLKDEHSYKKSLSRFHELYGGADVLSPIPYAKAIAMRDKIQNYPPELLGPLRDFVIAFLNNVEIIDLGKAQEFRMILRGHLLALPPSQSHQVLVVMRSGCIAAHALIGDSPELHSRLTTLQSLIPDLLLSIDGNPPEPKSPTGPMSPKKPPQRILDRPPRRLKLLDVEVFGFGVVHYNGGGALLRDELVFFREGDVDARGVEQIEELGLVRKVRARGVAEGVAAAMVFLVEPFANRGVIVGLDV